jgi:hypothetical protein
MRRVEVGRKSPGKLEGPQFALSNLANREKRREMLVVSSGGEQPRRNWLLAGIRNANDNEKKGFIAFPR